jgi:hypothetical protein
MKPHRKASAATGRLRISSCRACHDSCYLMLRMTTMTGHEKISAEFAARLKQFQPGRRVRAILMLDLADSNGVAVRPRRTHTERQQEIQGMREAGKMIITDIDKVLKRFGGQRLSESVDALGCLPVETTPDAFRVLTSNSYVKAILEDQSVSLMEESKLP